MISERNSCEAEEDGDPKSQVKVAVAPNVGHKKLIQSCCLNLLAKFGR